MNVDTNQDAAGSAAGDFKAQFVERLAEFPALKTFFETSPAGVRGDPGVLDLLVDPNPAVHGLLSILQDVVKFQDDRYNATASEAQLAATEAEATINQMQETI